MYSTLVIAYLFLGGAASGAFLVMASWSLAFHKQYPLRSERPREYFRALKARVYAVSTVLLVLALICLLWDLKRPDRALLIFLKPHATPLTFGAYTLALLLLIGVVLMLANVFHLQPLRGRVKQILEIACIPFALAAMSYTGVFLYSNISIAFWHTWSLVGLFLFSSLSSGLCVVMLVDYFSHGQTRHLQAVRPLQRIHLACLVAEGVFIAAFVMCVFANTNAAASVASLMSTNYLPAAVIGVIGFGLVIPFALETYALRCTETRAIPLSDFICLLGALCLRWIIMMCGMCL